MSLRDRKNALLWSLTLTVNLWAAWVPGAAAAVQLPASVNTSATPSTVTFDSKVFVFYKGAGEDPGIYLAFSDEGGDPGDWSVALRLPWAVNTSAAPSALVDDGAIYVVYKGSGSDTAIYVARSYNGIAWDMTQLPGTVNTSTGPGTYIDPSGTLHVVYKGSGSDARIYAVTIPSTTTWTYIGPAPLPTDPLS